MKRRLLLTEGDHEGRLYKDRYDEGRRLWAPCSTKIQELNALFLLGTAMQAGAGKNKAGLLRCARSNDGLDMVDPIQVELALTVEWINRQEVRFRHGTSGWLAA